MVERAKKSFKKMVAGYSQFRDKYVYGDFSFMNQLSVAGQKPEIMVISCCDSRVDPAVILQCDPGDLFIVRNVANIVPAYTKDDKCHGTSAALEFAVKFLNVEHLILFGHSQCGGIAALLKDEFSDDDDFLKAWVSQARSEKMQKYSVDEYAEHALKKSYKNCLTFPWIADRVANDRLAIHLWFFDIKSGQIFTYCHDEQGYKLLNERIKNVE
ncbi:carbonic anhydrase [Candidatus Dependentiae bacterium]|nr:carbonic anhydrase [Candidatus Dependentiae bacterium]